MSSRASAASSALRKTTPNTISKTRKSTATLKLDGEQIQQVKDELDSVKGKFVGRHAGDKIPAGGADTGKPGVTGRHAAPPNAWVTKPTISTTDKTQGTSQRIQNISLRSEQSSVVSQINNKIPATSRPRNTNNPVENERGPLKNVLHGSSAAPCSTARSVYEGNRPFDWVQSPTVYTEGVVFSTTIHEHHYEQNNPDTTKNDISISHVGVVNSKFKKFIVVQVFMNHVICLPVYTHRKNGLKNIRDKDEHVSVRENNFRTNCAPAETIHGTIWHEAIPKVAATSTYHYMSDLTSIHFTHPYSHRMDKRCVVSGQLLPDSSERLIKLFKDALDQGNTTPIAGNNERSRPFSNKSGVFDRNLPQLGGGGSSIAGNRALPRHMFR